MYQSTECKNKQMDDITKVWLVQKSFRISIEIEEIQYFQIYLINLQKEIEITEGFKIIQYRINMNLPAINNKMKNQNHQFKQDSSSSISDGFGLGIQVFKIQSVKNIDANLKSKNRTLIKNIQNPNQPTIYKQPILPKPKKLPSLQKSHSQINSKDRTSAFLNNKIPPDNMTGYSDKIMERKSNFAQSNTIVTPVSYSMRKKVGVSTQKNISNTNIRHPFQKKSIIQQYAKNTIIQAKQKPSQKIIATKVNQTAPAQIMYKPEQTAYFDYHRQNRVLLKFYGQFENCEKQHLKEVKQLKKLKQNQQNQQVVDRINYLLSLEGKIESVIQSLEKQQFQQKLKEISKYEEKKNKKLINYIVPISPFPFTQMDMFEFDGIQKYQNADFSGGFDVKTYDMVDLAPPVHADSKKQQQ